MKKRTAIIAGAITALLSSAAFGGAVQPFPVEVNLVDRMANGDMVTARYSDNKVEMIGCGIRKIEDGAGGIFSFGFCQARDADNVRGFCNTQNADLLDAIYASADYGFITFSWNEDGQCTRIGFSNQSFYLPKGLDSNN